MSTSTSGTVGMDNEHSTETLLVVAVTHIVLVFNFSELSYGSWSYYSQKSSKKLKWLPS